jgi:hypothetical protein
MQEDNILNIKNQELGFIATDLRDKNLEKALSVVAPIDGIINNLQVAGKMPKEKTPMDFVMADANKVKMEGYSDVKFQDLFREYSDGEFVARYENPYSISTTDQEDYAAKQQSSGELWGNAFPKYWGKLLTNTVGQLAGIGYGLYDMAQTGSMQSLYDNKFMDYMNDVNTYMDNKLPTYKSKEDREATGLDYFMRPTTWADDFANGMAFFGGAILSEVAIEWATGGAAMSTAGARWGAKLAQSERFLNTLNKARTLANPAAKVFATGQLETKLATNLGRAGELLNTARFTATSAGFESAFEANAFQKEMEQGYYADFERLNGRMPTREEEMEFRRNLKTASDGVFATNMAIVGSSNLAVMGKWFNIKNPMSAPTKWAESKLFGIGYKKVGEEFVETSANKLQKALGKSYTFTKPMFVEGVWEEGMQSAVQNTGRNWVEAKYDPQYTKNGLSLIDSFSNGLAETYGTAEGWKEIQMGMLIGLIGGTAGNRIATGKWNPEYSRAKAENKLIVDTRNTYSGTRIAEAMAYGNRVQQAQENSQKAEAAGDFVGQETSRKDAALAQLNFAYNLGYMDEAVSDTVTAIKNMDNETLMQEYGVDEKGAEELKQNMIDEYKTTANNYKKNSDFANYFINSKLSKEEKELLKGHDVSALREALAYELTMGAEMDTFSSNILEAIKKKVGTTILGQDISDTLAIEDVLAKAGKETKKQVEKKVSQITKLKSDIMALDEDYKKLETTFYNSTSEEQKKSILAKMDAITTKKAQLEQERTNLAKEADILFSAAKLKNPFNKDGSNIIITAAKLEVLQEQSQAIKDLISSYEKVSPQDALELQKLVEEYSKSLNSFQRYADLARQITDPKLGLKGKRNIISEIRRDKSPNEATIEMIESLLPRMVQAKNQVADATAEGQKEVKEVIDEGKDKKVDEVRETQKNGDTIPKPTAEDKQYAKEIEKQKVIDEYNAKIAGLEKRELKEGETYTYQGKTVKVISINQNIGGSIGSIEVEDENGRTRTINNPYKSDEFFKYSFKTIEDTEDSPKQIAKLREQEQKELLASIPEAKNALTNGKVDKNKLTNPEDIAKFEEIYDKYDKLITPLLKGQESKVKISEQTQDEFAQYLQDNYSDKLTQEQIYNLLTVRPELRERMLTESPEEWAKIFESNPDYRQQHNNVDNNKEMRGTSNPAWTGISVGNPANTSTEGRHKGYLTLDVNSAREMAKDVEQTFKDLYNLLEEAGYNGHLKMPGTFSDLLTRFDNIVIHGASKQDVDLALPIIEKYFKEKGLTVEGTKTGLDAKDSTGKETSHTNLLAEKVKNKRLTKGEQTVKDNTKEIAKLEKEKQAKLDAIDKKYQDKTEEPTQEKKSLIDSIVDMVKNSPYLLENFGSNILDLIPTQAEIEEFYELAARAIDDPRIDTELIAFKNPYNSNRFTPTTRPSLTKAEVTRLQELNQKMANWQLIEGYQNENGVSLQQMIMQAVAVKQTVEPIIREKLTDSDLINLSDTEPLEIENSKGIRKEQYVQVYENVFVKKKGNSIQISHLTLPGLLQRMGITGEIGYVQTKYEKGKKVEVKGSAKVLTAAEVEDNALPGANFIVTLADGSKVNLSIERSGAISVNSEDFPKVMSEANMKHVEGTLNRNGGYSPVYDLETGEKLKTDYRNASDYSPREIYNMEPGESAEVTFSIDMNDEYNLKLIQNYEKGLEEGRSVEELEKELFENIKINVVDTNGRKLGDLKAAYDIAGIPGYLDLRREAFEVFKNRMESGIMGVAALSKASYIKHIFLGSPNFTFEDGAIKMFDIIPEQVVDYGYIENGKLVLKNNTKGVREDFVKGLLGRTNQPVVVVKQGKYLIAFPIALKESQTDLAEQVAEIFTTSKNRAEAALKLNQLLADNGFSPASYNLFYVDENNQNIVDSEGKPTEDLLKAVSDLASVRNVSSVKDWLLPEHTTTDLANEASIGVDMADNMFSSPKPIIELDDLKESIKDWYADALKEGDVSEEKAIEIATKIFYRKRISLEEAQFVQSDRVTEALNRMYELNNEAQKEANSEKNKPCE